MEVIYGLLPGMLILGVVGVAVFFWAVRSGQYDDMDGAANRLLMDDDDPVSDSEQTDDSETTPEQK
jgi:cbb3-type cytochrome oxidase maturation protein